MITATDESQKTKDPERRTNQSFPSLLSSSVLRSWFSIFTPIRLAFLLTLLGGALRLYHFTKLGLWLDEGGSIGLERLPWNIVLFKIDDYDTHPPLYPAMLKLLHPFLPEIYAGRILSVVVGTLTIPVVHAIGNRLLGARVGLVAAALLAISPLHIWYSQETRSYVIVAFVITLSYLALVAFHQELRLQWAALYAVITCAALYLDYSSIYSLAPQALIFLWMFKEHGRRSLPIFIAAAAAILGYLPWLPKMFSTVGGMTQERAAALGVTPGTVLDTIVSILGWGGFQRYFYGTIPTPWDTDVSINLLILALTIPAIVVSVIVLARRPALPALVIGGMFAGTLLMGVLVGLYKPGFAERTVLAAAPGVCLLLACVVVALAGRPALILRVVGIVSVVCIAAGSALTLHAIYAGGDKDHWRELFSDLTYDIRYDYPVITFHTYVDTLAHIYAPEVVEGNYTTIDPPGTDQAAINTVLSGHPNAVWLTYLVLPGLEQVQANLERAGYRRVLHDNYSIHAVNAIFVDLYALPGTPVLKELPFNGTFAGSGTQATDWNLPEGHTTLEAGQNGGRTLVLTNPTQNETRAYAQVPAQPRQVYRVQLQAQAQLNAGGTRMFLLCTSAGQAFLNVAPDDRGADVPSDGAWHEMSISADCPQDTQSIIVDLRNSGVGVVRFRDIHLQTLRLPGE